MGEPGRFDAALVDALREWYGPLRRYAAVVGRWDVDPDDLVQDAYAAVLRNPPADLRHPGAYLRRAILNLASNERRRQGRARAAYERLDRTGGTRDAYPSELADLLRLEPRARGLLYLVEVEGEPIAAAAAAVGMSAPAARMALTRARRRLRGLVDEEVSGG